MMATKKAGPGGPAAPKIADATSGDVASALVPREYFRLPAAAQLLGLTADDLVHMAKQGALRLGVLGGGRSFRVVETVERQRVTGRTDGGPKISAEQHATMRTAEAAVRGLIKVPKQFVEELEAVAQSTPHYFDDGDNDGRMLIPLLPFQVSTDDLVIGAVEFEQLRFKCEGLERAANKEGTEPANATSSATSEGASGIKRQALWRDLVLATIRKLNVDPKALPAFKNGTECPTKFAVRATLVPSAMTISIFNRAWQELRSAEEIENLQQP